LGGLAQDRTVIRYDARGNGMSDWDVDEISLNAWVSDLECVVEANRLERFPLLGISQGCPVACRHAPVAKRLVPTVRPTYHSQSLRESDL
jgi:pimeloyl-ACP methyl ester carboxylesterase